MSIVSFETGGVLLQTPPSTKGFLNKSGPIVELDHGLTFAWGLEGSGLNPKLAFLKLWPTVFTPIWWPASKKLTPFKIPSATGYLSLNSCACLSGNKSSGCNVFWG